MQKKTLVPLLHTNAGSSSWLNKRSSSTHQALIKLDQVYRVPRHSSLSIHQALIELPSWLDQCLSKKLDKRMLFQTSTCSNKHSSSQLNECLMCAWRKLGELCHCNLLCVPPKQNMLFYF